MISIYFFSSDLQHVHDHLLFLILKIKSMQSKTLSLLLAVMTVAVWLMGCSKSNPTSIVGVWTTTSGSKVSMVSHNITDDSTYQISGASVLHGILTLSSNGRFNFAHAFSESGLYTYADDMLTLIDTNFAGKRLYKNVSLNSDVLSLQTIDTISINPLTMTIYTINFSK
jgi:hypothetical protein